MANKMLIDATHPEETRVVVLRGNRVEEFDFETAQRKQLRGNIYLAKVTRVEPSLQAAFIDYGGNRHGFLAFSEIHPDYYQIPVADRQALIDADARAARDEDDEIEVRGRRSSGRGRRNRSMAAGRNDEGVRSEAVAGDGPAERSAEALDDAGAQAGFPGGGAVPDAAQEPAVEPAVPFEAAPVGEAAPVVGESANPPVAGEIAAIYEPPSGVAPPASGESDVSAAQPFEPIQPEAQLESRSDESPLQTTTEQPEEQPTYTDAPAPSDDRPFPTSTDSEPDTNGNGGHEEEEEVVESIGGGDALDEVLDRAPRYRRQYKIQEVIKRRQVMLVQVVKEERGTKGAALTTYLSLAGRYCVLMPNTARGGGISRKITSAEDRKKLREIADELEVPEGMGVILRTAGAARTKAEVKRDFEYLLRLWEQVRDLTLKSTAPMLVYEEGSLAKRSIRDLYAKDIDEIVVAGEQGYKDAKEFMRMLMPSHAKNVKLYKDTQPVFTRYGIESQLDAMFSPTVQLKSGGYIVLNQTEALVAIDVNSGRSTREHHIEDTALKTNIEAAEEIARQLRLRDLAGLIVIDFIDMDEKRNNRTVERRLKDALRNDRARIQVGRISHFGLLEMSRQRIRTSVLESSTEKCPHCGGSGHMRSVSSVALQLLRSIEEVLLKGATHNLIVRTRPEIALYALNQKRAHLRALEERFQISITIAADGEIGGQTGFAIERSDLVRTPDQARAIVAQSEAGPVLYEEDEPEVAEETDDTPDGDVDGDADLQEPASAGDGSAQADDENGREGGRGRRRRRRRRGRGGEDRDRAAPAHAEDGAPEHGDFAHVHAGGQPQPFGDHEPADSDHARDDALAAEAGDDGEPGTGGDGEHDRKRRRRGRRGGRRNRRDRDEQTPGDVSAATGGDAHDGPPGQDDGQSFEPTAQPWNEPANGQPAWAEPAPVPDLNQAAPAPQAETMAGRTTVEATPESAAEPQPAAPESPRRRSTVREPAPIFGTSEPVVTPLPVPPQPSPPDEAAAPAEDASKPRRTGWWARRLMGGNKG